jgi:hypothetical protein
MRLPALLATILLAFGCADASADKGGGHGGGPGDSSGAGGSRLIGGGGLGPIQALEDHARLVKSQPTFPAALPSGIAVEFQAQTPQDGRPDDASGRSGHGDGSDVLERNSGRDSSGRLRKVSSGLNSEDPTKGSPPSAAILSRLFAPWTTVPAGGDKPAAGGAPSACGPIRATP